MLAAGATPEVEKKIGMSWPPLPKFSVNDHGRPAAVLATCEPCTSGSLPFVPSSVRS